ncbi:hypothetical protein GO491_01200 [Flavobacteriaceae bacterium Ap0902]|nr:hypothetical protein [Flavobacteriaceae bacterium Ap0902]
MKYLQFNSPWENFNKRKFNLVEKIIFALKLSSNPDYDQYKIDEVRIWLIEFDEEDIPIREIGLKENGEVILKMPFKKNYGFWTDNILKYSDFIERFSAEPIDAIFFNEKWNELE